MAKPKANAPRFPTVTMVDSRTLTRADGTTSLRLDTKEFGSIAFRIDLKAIEILRRELATAEAFLRQPTGSADGGRGADLAISLTLGHTSPICYS